MRVCDRRSLAVGVVMGLVAATPGAMAQGEPLLRFPAAPIFSLSADGTVGTGLLANNEVFIWRKGVPRTEIGRGTSAPIISRDASTIAFRNSSDQAVRWVNGQVVPLGGAGAPMAISADGRTIVGNSPFRWTASGGFQPVNFGANFQNLNIQSLSNDGRVVTGFFRDSQGDASFRWSHGSQPQVLPKLPGFNHLTASVISGDGSTIYGLIGNSSPNRIGLFRWTAAGGTVLLRDGQQDMPIPLPSDASFDGGTVGGVGFALQGGWIRLPGQPIRNIGSIIREVTGQPLLHLDFYSVNAISNDGRVIAGSVFNYQRNENRGFVFRLPDSMYRPVPTPGAAGVLAAGLLWAARRRR